MCAYIVEDKTINRIVSYLSSNHEALSYMKHVENIDLTFEEDEAKFGQELFDLNVRAINERYGNGTAENFRDLDYHYAIQISCNIINAYKSLECLIYQCSEGSVPGTELYQKLERIKGYLASQIISNLPEYKRAIWG